MQLYASYAFVDARFLDALKIGSNSPFADDDGNIQILPGNQVPAIPRHRVKAGFDYAITDAFKVGADATFVSSQYFVGDESNQAPKLTSYAVANVHASYQINKTFQIYGRIDNLFDNRYATYGTFFDIGEVPNFTNGGAPFTDAALGQPGAAARVLCGIAGDVLTNSRNHSRKPVRFHHQLGLRFQCSRRRSLGTSSFHRDATVVGGNGQCAAQRQYALAHSGQTETQVGDPAAIRCHCPAPAPERRRGRRRQARKAVRWVQRSRRRTWRRRGERHWSGLPEWCGRSSDRRSLPSRRATAKSPFR